MELISQGYVLCLETQWRQHNGHGKALKFNLLLSYCQQNWTKAESVGPNKLGTASWSLAWNPPLCLHAFHDILHSSIPSPWNLHFIFCCLLYWVYSPAFLAAVQEWCKLLLWPHMASAPAHPARSFTCLLWHCHPFPCSSREQTAGLESPASSGQASLCSWSL